MMRIIHISDLHLESENPSYAKRIIIKALAEDLKNKISCNTVLFFTGDLIDKGAKQFSNKEEAFQSFEKLFIDPIIEANPTIIGKIFVVPGNHDVYRNKIDKYSEAGLKNEIDSVKSLEAFIQENRTESKHLDRLEDYKKWEKNFFTKNTTQKILQILRQLLNLI